MKPEDLNPENDPEVRITALLLGELTAEEETELRAVMAQNPELLRLHDRLKVVMGLVKDAVPTTEPLTQSLPEPMTLAEERRAELLAVFKGQAPKPKEKKIIKVSFWQRQKADLLKLAAMLVGLLAVTWVMLPKREAEEMEFLTMLGRDIKGVTPLPAAAPVVADPFYSVPAKSEPEVALVTSAATAAKRTDAGVESEMMVTNAISFSSALGDASTRTFAPTESAKNYRGNIALAVKDRAASSSTYAVQNNQSLNLGASFAQQAQGLNGTTVLAFDDSMNRSVGSRGSQIALPALAAADGEQEVTRKTMTDQAAGTVVNLFSSFQNDGAIVSGNNLALNEGIAGKPMASPGQSGSAGGGGVGGGGAGGQTHWGFGTQNGRGGGEPSNGPQPNQSAVRTVEFEKDFAALPQSQVTQLGLADSRKLAEAAENKPREMERLARTEPTLTGKAGNGDMFFGEKLAQPSEQNVTLYSAMGRTDRPVIDAYDVEAKPASNRPVEAKMKSAAAPTIAGQYVAVDVRQLEMLADNDSFGLVPTQPAAPQPMAGPAAVVAGDKVDAWRKAREEYLPEARAKEKTPVANQVVNGVVTRGITVDINGGARTVLNGEMKGVSQLGADASGVTLNYAAAPEMPRKPEMVDPAARLPSGAVDAKANNLAFYDSSPAQPAPATPARVNRFVGRNTYMVPEGKPLSTDQYQDSLAENGAAHAFANGDRVKMATLGDAQKNMWSDSSVPTPVPTGLPQRELRLRLNRGMTLADVDGDGEKMPSPKQDGFNLDVVDLQVESKVSAAGVVLDPQGKNSYGIQDNAMRLGEVSQKAESFEYRKQPLSEIQRDEVAAMARAKLSTARRENEDVLAEGLKREGNGLSPSPAGTVVSAPAPVVAMDLVADGTVALKTDAITLPTTPSLGPVDASEKGKKQDVSQMVRDAKVLVESRRTDDAELKLKQALKEDPENKAAHYYMELAQEQKFGDASRKRDYEQRSKIVQAGGIQGRSEDLLVANPYVRNDMAKIELPKAQESSVEELKKGITVTGRLEVDKLKALKRQDEKQVEELAKLSVEAKQVAKDEPAPQRPPSAPAGIPQPEVSTVQNAFSTFSLNVSDVSFKLAAASLEKGLMPEPATVRTEEFINAFNYHDAEPTGNARVAFAWERARYPFAHDRDLVRFAVKTGAVGREPGKPLNIVLLLDNSGSMERADRVQIRRECLRVLGGQLQAQDTVSVVAFARTARLWVDGLAGNKAEELQERVGNLTPEGGTNLEEAMNLAYATAQKHFVPNGVNRVVLLTDGAANLGDVSPDSLKKKVVSYRQQGVALDCFGIGWEGYNDDLLEALSRNGDGRYGFVNSPEAATTEFASQLAGALQVAASDVKVQVEWNPKRVTVFRQLGYAKHQLKKEEFRDNKVDAAEIGAAEAGNALYTVQVNPAGEGPLGVVRVRYRVPNTSDYREHEWTLAYDGASKPMEQSSVPLRLAATASAFSEWLVASPFAGEVTAEGLITQLSGVPEAYPADPRPKQLEWMIRQAKSLSGR